MKITSKGQVTIPIEIREKAGLYPDTEVDFIFDRGVVKIIKKKGSKKESRGWSRVNKLKGKAKTKLSTEQIMSLTRGEK